MKSELFIPKNLILVINQFYTRAILHLQSAAEKTEECILTYTGLDIFLKFLPESFKKEFLKQIPSEIVMKRFQANKKLKIPVSKAKMDKMLTKYCNQLRKKTGLKLFIGKDAYSIYTRYKRLHSSQNDSAFLPYSRLALFRVSNGNGYFQLVDLYYKVYLNSSNLKEFIQKFKEGLRNNTKLYLQIEIKTLKLIAKYKLYEILKKHKKIYIVDSGTQGGLIFPLYTVLENEGYHCDFSLFACFNWAYPLIKTRTFTKDLYTFLHVEEEGMMEYKNDYSKRKN